jgi:hypothetical protein
MNDTHAHAHTRNRDAAVRGGKGNALVVAASSLRTAHWMRRRVCPCTSKMVDRSLHTSLMSSTRRRLTSPSTTSMPGVTRNCPSKTIILLVLIIIIILKSFYVYLFLLMFVYPIY